MKNDLAMALDPVLLAERLAFTPDPWQAQVLRTAARQVILNCSRQTGKSTITALLALHQALYCSPSLVLLLSPSLRQSGELFRKVTAFYRQIEKAAPVEAESALRLELENGSRVVSLPGKEQTVRGFSGVTLLVVDEAARVPDALYYAIRPMLAVSGGRIVLLSTPFGTRGFFFREWQEGEGWNKTKITAYDCPRIPAEFLEEEKRTIGEWWFRQEYLGEFLDAQSQAFTYEAVQAAFKEAIEPWKL